MDLANTGLGVPNLPAISIQCDLCGEPFCLPQHCIDQGEIIGLLVCTACCEDELQSRNVQ